MTKQDVSAKLQEHKSFLNNQYGSGKRADFCGADGLSRRRSDGGCALEGRLPSNFRGANMRKAVCIGTDFTNARMDGANMQGVDARTAKGK